jgi:Flp pilus assembly pilin Flp
MLGLWKRVVRNERGQDLAEYGIALGLVGAVAAAAALAMSMQIGSLWESADETISGVVQGDPGNQGGHGGHGHGHGGNGGNGHHHGGGNSGNGGRNGAGN